MSAISTGVWGDSRERGPPVRWVSWDVCFIFCLFKLCEFARIII